MRHGDMANEEVGSIGPMRPGGRGPRSHAHDRISPQWSEIASGRGRTTMGHERARQAMGDPNSDPQAAPGLIRGSDGNARCFWAGPDPLYMHYHDREWGVPTDSDALLFEKICLEGFQSGLSWLTILRKRDNFREAFAGFEFERVAEFTDGDVERLLGNAGIVRHRGKIASTINNARQARELAAEAGSLASYFWSWEPAPDSRPALLDHETLLSLTSTPESSAMSKDLKRRGWTFVGPTTAYAFMQAMGLVNDHIKGCRARPVIEKLRAGFQRPRPSSP